MRFMKRPTLAGSFSSRSPSDEGSASDSRRASSDFTVAKRGMTRLSAEPPPRGPVRAAATDGRRIRVLSLARTLRDERDRLAERLRSVENELSTLASRLEIVGLEPPDPSATSEEINP